MIRFGTIGTSKIAEEFISGVRKVNGCAVTICYSRTMSRAETFIEQNSLSKAVATTNFNEMLDLIDAVYISSPNSLHYDQAKFFLENKKHVLLEKPLTFTVKELDSLRELANENQTILMEAFKPLHLPQYKTVKQWVGANDAFLATLVMNQYSSRMGEVNMGIYRSAFDYTLGKGSTYDLLIYPVELAIGLFGKVKRLHSFTKRLENGSGLTNIVLLEHENGVLCNITCSKAARGVAFSEINGNNGTTLILNHLPRLQNIKCYRLNSKVPILEVSDNNEIPFVYELNDFLTLINKKDFDKMNANLSVTKEAIAVLEMVEMSN